MTDTKPDLKSFDVVETNCEVTPLCNTANDYLNLIFLILSYFIPLP